MAQIVAAFASSHAYALMPPERWDARREVSRGLLKRRQGIEAPERAEVEDETTEANQERYARLRAAFTTIRRRLVAARPDALILIGDDQDENFRDDNMPQFAIHTGPELLLGTRDGTRIDGAHEDVPYQCDAELASQILNGMVETGFDLASTKRLSGDRLKSHAHTQILSYLEPEARIPLVPIFVNATHPPAPTPTRCYQFGEGLRRVIDAITGDKRVALYASGGLSHFPPDFPFAHYDGPASLGWIDIDFDRQIVGHMAAGRGAELARLSSADLLNSGNMETRQWIMMLGALGEARPTELVYEPFYRGIMGMAAGTWVL